MRPLLTPLIVFTLLAACDTNEPPPGELIGSFRFVAQLEAGASPERCLFSGAPQQLSFEGVLSHDPLDGRLWITSGRSRREGMIENAHFVVRAPASGPGILRQMSACSCGFRMVEVIEGDLLTPAACSPSAVPVATPSRSCPELLDDGRLDWSDCGCVRGTIREEVEFVQPTEEEAPCTCEIEEAMVPAPASCEFIYNLEGSLL